MPPAGLRWGILGTGSIAKTFSSSLSRQGSGRIAAVGSRSLPKAVDFADRFGIAGRYGSYQDVLADPGVTAVYVALPHHLHAAWSIRAARAGKHILCEKPLAMNHRQAAAIIDEARARDVFLMEGFSYRTHPQTQTIVRLIAEGALGTVQLIEAAFAYRAKVGATHRLSDATMGGGGILDVGCYTTSMARLIASATGGLAASGSWSLTGAGHLGETGVDEYAAATVSFSNGLLAQLCCGTRLAHDSTVQIYGSKAKLNVANPWLPGKNGERTTMTLRRYGRPETEILATEVSDNLFAVQAAVVERFVPMRQAPAMSWDDSLDNMRLLDSWRAAIGLSFPADQPDHDFMQVAAVVAVDR